MIIFIPKSSHDDTCPTCSPQFLGALQISTTTLNSLLSLLLSLPPLLSSIYPSIHPSTYLSSNSSSNLNRNQMPPSFHLPEPSTPVARPTAQQEDFKSRPPTARKAPMSSCPKKPTKGGGKAKVAPKKRGKKRGKKTKVVEEESSGETVIVTDIKDVTVDGKLRFLSVVSK